jgi:hypothetical protein
VECPVEALFLDYGRRTTQLMRDPLGISPMASTHYQDLEKQLLAAGAPSAAAKPLSSGALEITGPLNVLVNSHHSAVAFEDILLAAIPTLRGNELEMLVRALSERGMKRAGPILAGIMAADTYRREASLLWALGNALNAIDDPRTYDAVVALSSDTGLGPGRQMLFLMLPKIRSEAAFRCALGAVDDPTVRGHAIEAVGRFGRPEALPVLQELVTKPGLYEHKAKATAIRRLEGASGPRKG